MRYELLHATKSFNEKKVLEDVSFCLESGEVCCLMGLSGIGKTTLLRILMGLEKPDQVERNDFVNLKISAVFQENRLIQDLDVIRNIRIAAGKRNLLLPPETVLDGMLEREYWHLPVRSFSGGMKRRAEIARALAVKSDLLIMDEPFSGLDEQTRGKSIQKILECRQGRGLVLVTHQEEDAGLLGAGKIIMTSTC